MFAQLSASFKYCMTVEQSTASPVSSVWSNAASLTKKLLFPLLLPVFAAKSDSEAFLSSDNFLTTEMVVVGDLVKYCFIICFCTWFSNKTCSLLSYNLRQNMQQILVSSHFFTQIGHVYRSSWLTTRFSPRPLVLELAMVVLLEATEVYGDEPVLLFLPLFPNKFSICLFCSFNLILIDTLRLLKSPSSVARSARRASLSLVSTLSTRLSILANSLVPY
ncbi:hypothetical protein BpHYR1_046633 [Brachionus plicatilis]|uniref:Uncharacterized protein n=1 Tax=Brachionus plicatilis TaxID=10195 RepID=A0A3M7Q6H3_BRAPC|nr:hypothetical protein BpHYR1_046633 [Brachionus plicatilis]